MGRREFIVLSSTCAVGVLATGPKLLADALVPLAPNTLAIGFASLDTPLGGMDAFVSADSVPTGDGAFIGRDAKVTIEGTRGNAAGERQITTLCAEYEGDVVGRVSVYSWAYNTPMKTAGGRNTFRMPLDSKQRLTFQFLTSPAAGRRRSTQSGPETETPSALVLTTLSDPDTLKLRRGYYAIVPLDGDRAPNWSAFILQQQNGQVLLASKGTGAPYEHEHVVLRIDYATQ
jgi:hypothetical protein